MLEMHVYFPHRLATIYFGCLKIVNNNNNNKKKRERKMKIKK
jgi:hypothetical protein